MAKLHHEMTSDELRTVIMDTVDDLARDFAFYDRKDDEELPTASIQKAVMDGIVTVDDIVARFRAKLAEVI